MILITLVIRTFENWLLFEKVMLLYYYFHIPNYQWEKWGRHITLMKEIKKQQQTVYQNKYINNIHPK